MGSSLGSDEGCIRHGWSFRTNYDQRLVSPRVTSPSDAASVEHNKALSRRWIEVFNQRDHAAMDSLTLLQQLGLVVVPGPRLVPHVVTHQVKKLRTKR